MCCLARDITYTELLNLTLGIESGQEAIKKSYIDGDLYKLEVHSEARMHTKFFITTHAINGRLQRS